MALVRRFYVAYSETLGGSAVRDGEQIEKALKAGGYLARILEHAWPAVAPDKLVRALFAQPAFLAEAAAGFSRTRSRRSCAVEARAGATPTWRSSTRRPRWSARRRGATAT